MTTQEEIDEQFKEKRQKRMEQRRSMIQRVNLLHKQRDANNDNDYNNTGIEEMSSLNSSGPIAGPGQPGFEINADAMDSGIWMSGLTEASFSSISDMMKQRSIKKMDQGVLTADGMNPTRRLEPIRSSGTVDFDIVMPNTTTRRASRYSNTFPDLNSSKSSMPSYPSTGDGSTNEIEAHSFTDNSKSTITRSDQNLQQKKSMRSVNVSLATPSTDILTLYDDPSAMTFGRRIALNLMERSKWYNPRLRLKVAPNESFWTSFKSKTDNDNANDNGNDSGGVEKFYDDNYISQNGSLWTSFKTNWHSDEEEDADDSSQNDGAVKEEVHDEEMPLDSTRPRLRIKNAIRPITTTTTEPESKPQFEEDNNEAECLHQSGKNEVEDRSRSGRQSYSSYGSSRGKMMVVDENSSVTEIPGDDTRYGSSRKNVAFTPATTKKKPSLQKAWAYFEHITLPRYVVGEGGGRERRFDRATNSGEEHTKTKLYSPIFTPLSEMEDFGIGAALYFYTLRAFMIVSLMAGLINIPSIIYFSGPEYSDNGQDGIKWFLKGSAVCNTNMWIPCPMCRREDFDKQHYTVERKGSELLPFVLRTNCGAEDNGDVRLQEGLVNFATIIFILVSFVIISIYQKKKESTFYDKRTEHEHSTVEDYSIVIRNPPENATDPKEWKTFFEDNFDNGIHVTCCTPAIGNDELVRALVQRRKTLLRLERILPDNESHLLHVDYIIEIARQTVNERNVLSRLAIACGIRKGIPEYCELLIKLNGKIRHLASKSYPATNVFVTFETEASQKQVLSALKVAPISAWKNRTKDNAKIKHLFRNEHVLYVEEAMDPFSIRWTDLNKSTFRQFNSIFAMMIAAGLITVAVAVVVKVCFEEGTILGAVVLAFSNVFFPPIADILTNIETHKGEGSKQISFYIKILTFSWVNTVVLITIITPLGSIDVLLERVFAIFFAELITSTTFQLLDICGNFKRHYVAPRMRTQEAMNMAMEGSRFDLATRYTNMMKILFLTFWYYSIFPSVFFICACILCINLFVDKFSLMRSWRVVLKCRSTIPTTNQRYFFPATVGFMALISAYFWVGIPFDNLCQDDGEFKKFQGWPMPSTDDTLDTSNVFYKYCNQDLFEHNLSFDIFRFLVGSSDSLQQEGSTVTLKGDQAIITRIYLWFSVMIFGSMLTLYIGSIAHAAVKFFRVKYKPVAKDRNIPFSTIPSMIPYLPEVNSRLISYPLIPCPVNAMAGIRWAQWANPHSFKKNDLTLDVEQLLKEKGTGKISQDAFIRTAYYTPSSLAEM